MQSPKITWKKIYEHDIDLLIIEEFISDKSFARLFLNKVCLDDNYIVDSALHSLSDSDGESDITIILRYPDKKVALLIEDKIDAGTMPEQSHRYCKRGDSGKSRGDYDEYYVILSAPASYLHEHANDPNAQYPYTICYEDFLAHFNAQNTTRAAVKASIVKFAITEKENGYQVVEDIIVTEFWHKLRQFCKIHYPSLIMLGSDSPKGSSARWPEFRTSLRNVKVIYKSQKGYVDLEFPSYGSRDKQLRSIVKPLMTNRMIVEPTGKSAVLRIYNKNWEINFLQNFDQTAPVIDEVLQAVSELCDLAQQLDYYDLY